MDGIVHTNLLLFKQFLREELLPYFDAWEASARAREGFTPKEINLMMISKESRDGIKRSGMCEDLLCL